MCLFRIPLIHATVAPLFMSDYPTRMSISVSMRFSYPTCYLQDWDEIADDIIILKSRNRHINISTCPHSAIWHKPTSYGHIHKSAL